MSMNFILRDYFKRGRLWPWGAKRLSFIFSIVNDNFILDGFFFFLRDVCCFACGLVMLYLILVTIVKHNQSCLFSKAKKKTGSPFITLGGKEGLDVPCLNLLTFFCLQLPPLTFQFSFKHLFSVILRGSKVSPLDGLYKMCFY